MNRKYKPGDLLLIEKTKYIFITELEKAHGITYYHYYNLDIPNQIYSYRVQDLENDFEIVEKL